MSALVVWHVLDVMQTVNTIPGADDFKSKRTLMTSYVGTFLDATMDRSYLKPKCDVSYLRQ